VAPDAKSSGAEVRTRREVAAVKSRATVTVCAVLIGVVLTALPAFCQPGPPEGPGAIGPAHDGPGHPQRMEPRRPAPPPTAPATQTTTIVTIEIRGGGPAGQVTVIEVKTIEATPEPGRIDRPAPKPDDHRQAPPRGHDREPGHDGPR